MPASRRGVWSSADALTPMMVSAMRMFGWSAPHVPTRSSRWAPSMISSSNTMPELGHPMPVVWTEIGLPSNVPV